MSGRFGKFLNAKGMKIVPSYIGQVSATAQAATVTDGFALGTVSTSSSSDPAQEANNNKVISQSPNAALEKDYETPIDLTIRSFTFTPFTVFGFSPIVPFTVFGFSPVTETTPFTVFGFSPVTETSPFTVFGFSPAPPFTVFGFSPTPPFTVFGFSPISAFKVFGFSPVSFKVFGFSPISAFKVFGFSPVNVLRPAETLDQLIEENPSDI